MDPKEKINIIAKYFCDRMNEKRTRKSNLLDILIATILSQNTNDNLSLKAYNNLKTSVKKWEDILKFSEKKISKLIEVAGLNNQKSKTIKNLLTYLNKKYGKVDLEFLKKLSNEEIFSELKKINGIGTKTISCLLLFGLKRNIFPVDTHIHRIMNRLGIVKTKNANDTFNFLKELIPNGKEYCLHVSLIQFGREVCKSNKPLCNYCHFISYCDYKQKNIYSNYINIKRKNVIILNEI